MARETLERVSLLLNENQIQKLEQTTVLIAGLGGVGAIAAEALARVGVGHLVLVEHDCVSLSNINRQIHALSSTVGQSKLELMASRLKDINPNLIIDVRDTFITRENIDTLFSEPIDAMIDAIDTIVMKAELIQRAQKLKIHYISSMGMGNRLDPTKVHVTKLSKTTYDPVARVLRKLSKEYHLRDFKVIASSEHPIKQNRVLQADGHNRKSMMPPGSTPFVPNTAGLLAAYTIVDGLIKEER